MKKLGDNIDNLHLECKDMVRDFEDAEDGNDGDEEGWVVVGRCADCTTTHACAKSGFLGVRMLCLQYRKGKNSCLGAWRAQCLE